jgi:pyruvate kinase
MEALRKTKIICTMGPATEDIEVVKDLLRNGMNIARFNFSHGDHAYHEAMVERVRLASEKTAIPVALMLDTKGPEIRTGIVPDGGKILLKEGSPIVVTTDDVPCTAERISISYQALPGEISVGGHILIADGLFDLEVAEVSGSDIRCIVRAGGEIGSRKNVNVPGIKTSLPAVTEKDVSDLLFGIEQGFDLISASFIRKATDVTTIYRILDEHDDKMIVLAKIEDQEGLDNIDEIIRVSGGIMVARGDLGVQIPVTEIPLIQKRIIEKCNRANKPVITATQMMDSMIHNPKPTRAECTDVANAIMDGTDAIMLSGETANGAYPIEAVRMMHRIAMDIERSPEYIERTRRYFSIQSQSTDIAHAVAKAAYLVATDIRARAILTPTLSGNTPRLISVYRPEETIIAATPNLQVMRQLLLNWGVYPIHSLMVNDSDEMIQNAMKAALQRGYIDRFDKVVVTAGIPINSPIMTNTIKVLFLGNILNRGARGFGETVTGKIVKAEDFSQAVATLKKTGGEILLTRNLNESFIPVLRAVAGIILEGVSEMPIDRIKMINPDIVCVAGVGNAMEMFENNITVTLDGKEKIIYEGVI